MTNELEANTKFIFKVQGVHKVPHTLLISKLTAERTANPFFLGFKFFNYREAILAFPNHTAGFHTRLMVL